VERRFFVAVNRIPRVCAAVAVVALIPALAHGTPSTTYWAPSTASCQARGVPHVTYDTYFWKGPPVGSQGAPGYPIDTGLTAGVLPFNKLQAEAGFDILLPSPQPLFLNAKLCTPESSLFAGSPGISFGFYNLGFKKDVTNYNVIASDASKGIADRRLRRRGRVSRLQPDAVHQQRRQGRADRRHDWRWLP
jgi:hypothetical protein